VHEFEIKSMERKVWNSGQGSSLVINLALVNDAVDVSGTRTVNAGFPVTDRVSLVKKGKYDPLQAIARFLDATGTRAQGFDQTFDSYIGTIIQCKTKIRPEQQNEDGTVYPPQTEIAQYIKAH